MYIHPSSALFNRQPDWYVLLLLYRINFDDRKKTTCSELTRNNAIYTIDIIGVFLCLGAHVPKVYSSQFVCVCVYLSVCL